MQIITQAVILQNGLVPSKKGGRGKKEMREKERKEEKRETVSPTVPPKSLAIFSPPVATVQKLPGGKFFFKPSSRLAAAIPLHTGRTTSDIIAEKHA